MCEAINSSSKFLINFATNFSNPPEVSSHKNLLIRDQPSDFISWTEIYPSSPSQVQ